MSLLVLPTDHHHPHSNPSTSSSSASSPIPMKSNLNPTAPSFDDPDSSTFSLLHHHSFLQTIKGRHSRRKTQINRGGGGGTSSSGSGEIIGGGGGSSSSNGVFERCFPRIPNYNNTGLAEDGHGPGQFNSWEEYYGYLKKRVKLEVEEEEKDKDKQQQQQQRSIESEGQEEQVIRQKEDSSKNKNDIQNREKNEGKEDNQVKDEHHHHHVKDDNDTSTSPGSISPTSSLKRKRLFDVPTITTTTTSSPSSSSAPSDQPSSSQASINDDTKMLTTPVTPVPVQTSSTPTPSFHAGPLSHLNLPISSPSSHQEQLTLSLISELTHNLSKSERDWEKRKRTMVHNQHQGSNSGSDGIKYSTQEAMRNLNLNPLYTSKWGWSSSPLSSSQNPGPPSGPSHHQSHAQTQAQQQQQQQQQQNLNLLIPLPPESLSQIPTPPYRYQSHLLNCPPHLLVAHQSPPPPPPQTLNQTQNQSPRFNNNRPHQRVVSGSSGWGGGGGDRDGDNRDRDRDGNRRRRGPSPSTVNTGGGGYDKSPNSISRTTINSTLSKSSALGLQSSPNLNSSNNNNSHGHGQLLLPLKPGVSPTPTMMGSGEREKRTRNASGGMITNSGGEKLGRDSGGGGRDGAGGAGGRERGEKEFFSQMELGQGRKRGAFGAVYKEDEDSVRNDYARRYINTGERPQNFITGAELDDRFVEYPKLRQLLNLKHQLLTNCSHPPTYISQPLIPPLTNLSLPPGVKPTGEVITSSKADDVVDASSGAGIMPGFAIPNLLPTRFDVILVDPPKEFDSSRASIERLYNLIPLGGRDHTVPTGAGSGLGASTSNNNNNNNAGSNNNNGSGSSADQAIPAITAVPGFVWLWCGDGSKGGPNSGIGLEAGRELLARWGYRRAEDIVWVKPNKRNPAAEDELQTNTTLNHSKEHCLMGMKGTVKRSYDNWLVHCNIDTDVIVWEGDENDPRRKPPEIYSLIENFCLGSRRLELFGSAKSLRRGWLTVGEGIEEQLEERELAKRKRREERQMRRVREEMDVDDREEDPEEDWLGDEDQADFAAKPLKYVKAVYDSYFDPPKGTTVPNPTEIEALRPKSPKNLAGPSSGLLPSQQGDPLAPKGLGRGRSTPNSQHLIPGGMGMRRGLQHQQQQQREQQQQQHALSAGLGMAGMLGAGGGSGREGSGAIAMGPRKSGGGMGRQGGRDRDGGGGRQGQQRQQMGMGMSQGMSQGMMPQGMMGQGGFGGGFQGMSQGMPQGMHPGMMAGPGGNMMMGGGGGMGMTPGMGMGMGMSGPMGMGMGNPGAMAGMGGMGGMTGFGMGAGGMDGMGGMDFMGGGGNSGMQGMPTSSGAMSMTNMMSGAPAMDMNTMAMMMNMPGMGGMGMGGGGGMGGGM